jgi:hypothetical protein
MRVGVSASSAGRLSDEFGIGKLLEAFNLAVDLGLDVFAVGSSIVRPDRS